MANPFKPDDKVQTKVEGVTVDTVVRLVWNDEVQVRTAEGVLLWRTVKTVWYPGTGDQPPPSNDTTNSGQITDGGGDAIGGHSSVAPSEDVGSANNPDADAPEAGSESAAKESETREVIEPPVVVPLMTPAQITTCGLDEKPAVRRKSRRRK